MSAGSIIELDILFRGSGAGIAILEALILLRSPATHHVRRLGAVFAVSVAAYLLCPLVAGRWGLGLWALPMLLLCFTVTVWFWLFSRAWFDDTFRMRLWHWGALLGMIAIYTVRHTIAPTVFAETPAVTEGLHIASRIASLAFIFVALAQAQLGRADDLVERRRFYRSAFTIIVGAHISSIVLAEIILFGSGDQPVLNLLNVIIINIEMLLFLALSVTVRPGLFPTEPAAERQRVSEPAPDPDLLAAIDRFMTVDKGYATPGITIGDMAGQLGVPEYRLRRAVNRTLGFRNFPQFLNHYRLNAVRSRLADPAERRTPILTIALDAGYNSIGPFNRAFKEATGETPAAFRDRHNGLADS